ncbi:hypothetical protein NAEGRDRAFT_45670 [Naegleria gruberi]|uniref:Uncharacterized protein AM54 n=1 Tax=Naegleria gruberi TaxID=5762 RepID=D2V0D4_NAEGR|nr:uncharacterized protein NAEGRDRAFT_45670 [Naegleria gruberi]EFC49506.1 hypothetical protein NAEGRDRAFT_45670 [Naegleria gruberi]|eukprot:XP_002682250.1 hypothetical protein NAEGRDRAFT_45670 [Naegleria gruberi strain NEG-M]
MIKMCVGCGINFRNDDVKRFSTAVALMNTIDPPQLFFKLLNHILLKKLSSENQSFSSLEKERLLETFPMIKNDKLLVLLIDGCSYVFEQALYNALNPEKLFQELTESQSGISETHAQAFQEAWRVKGREYMNTAKEHTLGGPVVLENFDWRLQMQISESDLSKMKIPNVLFEFTTLDYQNKNTETMKPKEENIVVEFTKEELYGFFTKLEAIQNQLDKIS